MLPCAHGGRCGTLRAHAARVARHICGFSLVEALIASLLAATAIVVLVQLAATGARQAASARRAGVARALAQSKLEELRSLTFTYEVSGVPLGSPGLALSPDAALVEDHAGFVETLNRHGSPTSDGETPHFTRRWAIRPFEGDRNTLVLQVCVYPAWEPFADACVWTLRTRMP
jgi:type II secretory pathway pseudopilin PulG